MGKRGWGALLALLAALTLVAAGCGGDDNESSTATTVPAQLQLADLKGQTVEVAGLSPPRRPGSWCRPRSPAGR